MLKKFKQLQLNKSINFSNNNKNISGKAMVFSVPDSVGDVFDPNVIINYGVEGRPIDLLYNHEHSDIYASTRNKTLSFKRTPESLDFEATIFEDEAIYKKVKSGLVDGASCSFFIDNYKPNDFGGDTFTEITLLETSLTWEPCHLGTVAKSISGKTLNKEDIKELGIINLEKEIEKEEEEKKKGLSLEDRLKLLKKRGNK